MIYALSGYFEYPYTLLQTLIACSTSLSLKHRGGIIKMLQRVKKLEINTMHTKNTNFKQFVIVKIYIK